MSDVYGIFAEEPPDGTRLVVWREDEPPIVVERNDREAKNWQKRPDERWFGGDGEPEGFPQTFGDALEDATMVHAVVPLNQSGLKLTPAE